MSQQILQNSDFKSGNVAHNVQGILYRGEGSPLGQKTSTQIGAIYIDILSGGLWLCNSTASAFGWQPLYSQITTGITVSSDVQEGDLIGIYGAGAWATSGNLITNRLAQGVIGTSGATVTFGGSSGSSTPISSTEVFNGSTWASSGNLAVSAQRTMGFGSQNAGVMMGGAGVTATTATSISELYNGATWTGTGNLVISRTGGGGGGTQQAGIAIAGLGGAGTSISNSELFNGTTWTAGTNLIISREFISSVGTVNSALAIGGSTGSNQFSSTELYNGSTWQMSSNMIVTRAAGAASGSTTAGSIASGGGLGTPALSGSELFNGTTWIASGNIVTSRLITAGAGTQNSGIMVGGSTTGAAVLTTGTTELHNQSTYRRLNYSNLPCAVNIGMAYNVSATNSSASLCRGDIPNTRLASQNFFGFNRHTQEPNIVLEATRNITSITASGQTAIITTSSNAAICNGMLLQISNASNTNNNGLFPVINFSGGTQITVKNPNAVTQASATGTVQLIYANRLSGLATSTISVSGNSATINFSSIGGLSGSQMARLVQVGGNIYIPYAATSGTTGSQYNWGTYRITNVGAGDVVVTTLNAEAITETIVCTAVEYFGQCFTETFVPQGSFVMGFNNRLGLIQKPISDGAMNF